ncbi:MAG: hypothetical protein C3F13_13755 [Anaerolineales bacterium]|nr:MAG: hypothetical protein C3F13_13755 [Anaerolineales bacterium]
MTIPKSSVAEIIAFLIIGVIIFRIINAPFLTKQAKKGKGNRHLWGNYLSILGAILTSLG